MQVIYASNPTQWVEYDKRLEVILATVGTAIEHKKIGMPGPLAQDKIHWTASLTRGRDHDLWGENQGMATSIEEAKAAALNFLRISR